jgi:short-subunit dehydrogenase
MLGSAILITGAARYSLGEALVREYLRREENAPILAINRSPNPDLDKAVGEIILDLNPLNHCRGLAGFAAEISQRLEQQIKVAGCRGIGRLIQSAAVYDFGKLSDYDAPRRGRLLGLNILGTTEVLSAVLALNGQLQISNEATFTQILVGAFQGLKVREGRQLYASSKAWGIDLCKSLVAGKEIARCIFGPQARLILQCSIEITGSIKLRAQNNFSTRFFKVLDLNTNRYSSDARTAR